MKERVPRFFLELIFNRGKFEELDLRKIPTMRFSNAIQLVFGFRKGNV